MARGSEKKITMLIEAQVAFHKQVKASLDLMGDKVSEAMKNALLTGVKQSSPPMTVAFKNLAGKQFGAVAKRYALLVTDMMKNVTKDGAPMAADAMEQIFNEMKQAVDANKDTLSMENIMSLAELQAMTTQTAEQFRTEMGNAIIQSGVAINDLNDEYKILGDKTLKKITEEYNKQFALTHSVEDAVKNTKEQFEKQKRLQIFLTDNKITEAKQVNLLTEQYERQLKIHQDIDKAINIVSKDVEAANKLVGVGSATQEEALETYMEMRRSISNVGDASLQAENKLRKMTQVSWKDALQSAESMEKFLGQIGSSFAAQVTVVAALAWDVIKDVYDKSVDVAVLWGSSAADVSTGVLKISSSFRVANEQIMGVVSSMSQFVNLGDLSDKATRDMVGSLAQLSKVTGLSTEAVGEFGTTAMQKFNMSKEEVADLTKTMGSFAGKTTKDMQGIMKSMESYQELMVTVYGKKGLDTFKQYGKEIAQTFNTYTAFAKEAGISTDEMNKFIGELADPKNASKLQLMFGSFEKAQEFGKNMLDPKKSFESFSEMLDNVEKRFEVSNLDDATMSAVVSEQLSKQLGISKQMAVQMIKQRDAGVKQYGTAAEYQKILNKQQVQAERYQALTQKFSESWKLIKELAANVLGRFLIPIVNVIMKIVSWIIKIPGIVEAVTIYMALYWIHTQAILAAEGKSLIVNHAKLIYAKAMNVVSSIGVTYSWAELFVTKIINAYRRRGILGAMIMLKIQLDKLATEKLTYLLTLKSYYISVKDWMVKKAELIASKRQIILAWLLVTARGAANALQTKGLIGMFQYIGAQAIALGQAIGINVALNANPIGLIVIAVVALVGLFVLLWKKCEWFRKTVSMSTEIMKKWWPLLFGILAPVILLWQHSEKFRTIILTIYKFLKDYIMIVIDMIVTQAKEFWKVISDAMKPFYESMVKLGKLLWPLFEFIWKVLKPILMTIGAIIGVIILGPILLVIAALFGIFMAVGLIITGLMKLGTLFVKVILAPFKIFWIMVSSITGFLIKIKSAIVGMLPAWIQRWIGGDKTAKADEETSSATVGGQGEPSYAKGTDFVPNTGPAVVHKGEAIVTASDNAGMSSLLAEISDTNKMLLAIIQQYLPNIAGNTQKGGVTDMFTNFNASTGIM